MGGRFRGNRKYRRVKTLVTTSKIVLIGLPGAEGREGWEAVV